MVIYLPNQHADALVRYIKRRMDRCVPEPKERIAIDALLKSVAEEKTNTPYRMWQRDQELLQRQAAAPTPKPAKRTNRRKPTRSRK